MTLAATKRRPRRVGSDEAHSWARNLRLGNPYGKLVLVMLTIYVNAEGTCFVSVPQLAEDCEFAIETVRRRLAWLEGIGAIVRVAQWIDENGRRNGEGRGRRTTDDIRLMIDSDPEEIEAKARGNGGDDDHETAASDPLRQGGANQDLDSTGDSNLESNRSLLAPSLRGVPDSLNPEPEKNPPNPPAGGGQMVDVELEEDIEALAQAYPAPITDLPKLRAVLGAMLRAERRKVITAAKGYGTYLRDLERKGKSRNVKDAHRWVAQGMWQGYLVTGEKAEAAAQMRNVAVGSVEGIAFAAMCKIGKAVLSDFGSGHYMLQHPLSGQGMAFANAPPESEWVFVPSSAQNQVGAWAELLGRELGNKARRPLVEDTKFGRGFMAPWAWPPRKDGTIGNIGPPVEFDAEIAMR